MCVAFIQFHKNQDGYNNKSNKKQNAKHGWEKRNIEGKHIYNINKWAKPKKVKRENRFIASKLSHTLIKHSPE